jgi:aspartate/methionine/tyrosine aminotransferase
MFRIIDAARSLEVQGVDVVHLEIGDPDFNTPEGIKNAGIRAIKENETHYVSSWGMPEFRLAVQEVTKLSRGFRPDVGQVLITPGANISIFYAILNCADHGDEILYPDPGFPTYKSTIAATQSVGIPYKLREQDGFRMRVEGIEPLITSRTKLLIINSPQNPTGAVTEENELRKIFELARERDIWVFSDEIYARMNYGDTKHFSVASIDQAQERVILANGFSKSFAMTGWRLGTVVAPVQLAEKMMLTLQTTSSCVPPFVQRAGLAALNGDQQEINAMMLTYNKRRDILIHGLNNIPGISCHVPGGAFYAFPNISSFGLSSADFAERLLTEAGVAVVPGHHFGASGEGFIRMAYATSEERILEGLSRLKQFCASLAL